MPELMVKIENLLKVFEDGTRAVDSLDLEIREGEIFALFGPNGAGKTTMIDLMLGFIHPDEGSVKVGGINALKYPLKAKEHIGLIAESARLSEIFSARRNLRYFADLSGKDISEEGIEEVLRRVGLEGDADRAVGDFSAGMKQRLVVGAGLVKRPDLLILDEPWTALDPEGARDLSNLLIELNQDDGITLLVSTHELFRAHRVADRVGILVEGKVRRVVDASEIEDVEDTYLEAVGVKE